MNRTTLLTWAGSSFRFLREHKRLLSIYVLGMSSFLLTVTMTRNEPDFFKLTHPTAERKPVAQMAQSDDCANCSHSRRILEIRLRRGALSKEGIGAILLMLRGVMLVANETGARITLVPDNKVSKHKYSIREYLRIGYPVQGPRQACNLTESEVNELFSSAANECDLFNMSRAHALFTDCDMLEVHRSLGYPEGCAAHTAPIVKSLWIPELPSLPEKKDVCVLRRGGDVESLLSNPKTQDMPRWLRYRIDLNRTLPILHEARKTGKRTVLITQTDDTAKLRRLYKPDILANNETLTETMRRAATCKCLFTAHGSSFAVAVTQIAQPQLVIFTQPRDTWYFERPFLVSDFGNRAIPVTVPIQRIVQRCVYD